MRLLIIASLLLVNVCSAATVGEATSLQNHRVVLTNESCTVASGRSTQSGWGRTYSYMYSGVTVTGCGTLDGATVLVEWWIPPGTIDIRRYDASKFRWSVGYGSP